MSQEDVARLVAVSNAWYGRLERGEAARYSDDFLDRVALALRLTNDERALLYLYAVGREPAARPGTRQALPAGQMQRVVQVQPWPACLYDETWHMVAYNTHMSSWFPWVVSGVENNFMRWALTHPEARVQLRDWRTKWAPSMLAEMRMASARKPDNTGLGQLISEILETNSDARRMWEHETVAHVHCDGDHRQVRLPHGREVDIELVSLAPLRATDVRLTMFVPLTDVRPGPNVRSAA